MSTETVFSLYEGTTGYRVPIGLFSRLLSLVIFVDLLTAAVSVDAAAVIRDAARLVSAIAIIRVRESELDDSCPVKS